MSASTTVLPSLAYDRARATRDGATSRAFSTATIASAAGLFASAGTALRRYAIRRCASRRWALAWPGRPGSRPPQLAQPSQELVSASASADYLLSLVVLDPALGGDYLTTWASDVVVTVTAGQSSATRILAVGDMVRLAGPDSASAVLIRADKGDETLGLPATRHQDPAGASRKDPGS